MKRIGLILIVIVVCLGLVAWQSVSNSGQQPYRGTTTTVSPGALLAGACTSEQTFTVSGATTAMAVQMSPSSDPGASNFAFGRISSANTLSVRVCAFLATTPNNVQWNYVVYP